jgi:hypothetical protein
MAKGDYSEKKKVPLTDSPSHLCEVYIDHSVFGTVDYFGERQNLVKLDVQAL